jgi:hypothetical protein
MRFILAADLLDLRLDASAVLGVGVAEVRDRARDDLLVSDL